MTSALARLVSLTEDAVAQRRAGSFRAAARTVVTCHRIMQTIGDAQAEAFGSELVLLRLEWARCLAFAGDHLLALRGYGRVWDEAEQFGVDAVAPEAAASIALIHAADGDRRYSLMWLKRAEPIQTAESAPLIAATRAVLALEELDVPEAAAWTEAARDLETGEPWAISVWLDARVAALTDDRYAGMTRLRGSCLAHHSKLWASGLNALLIGLATAELGSTGQVSAPAGALTRPERTGTMGESSAALTRAREALRHDDRATVLAVTDELLADPEAGIRTTVAAQLLRAAADPDADDSRALADAALTTIGRERLYALLQSLVVPSLLPAINARAAQDPALAAKLGHVLGHIPVTDLALSNRERVIWWYLTQDLTLDQIAATEFVSRNTIKTQIRSLYRKLSISTRQDAIRLAREQPTGPTPPQVASR